MSTLIKVYDIPASVRKQFAKCTKLELYDDKLVGKGGGEGELAWHFKSYLTVKWTPASIATQFANLVFITTEGSDKLIAKNNLSQMLDVNRIMFCSGMFSYATANTYVEALYQDVKKAFDEYKTRESAHAASEQKAQGVSSADEIWKFKELLDEGIITQEEFDAKKKQIMGI